MRSIKLHFSEALVRKSIRIFWLRSLGRTFFLATAILLACFSYLVWQGDRSWWVGVFGSILAMAAITATALYVVHYRRSMKLFRRMGSPEAMLKVGEERFRLSSSVGTSEFDWSAVTEIWRYPDFWLVFLSRAQFFTIPTAGLDAEAGQFILAKVEAHGGRIS